MNSVATRTYVDQDSSHRRIQTDYSPGASQARPNYRFYLSFSCRLSPIHTHPHSLKMFELFYIEPTLTSLLVQLSFYAYVLCNPQL